MSETGLEKPAQILLITDTHSVGGTERSILNLAQGLDKQNIPVRALLPKPPADPDFEQWAAAIFPKVELVEFPHSASLEVAIRFARMLQNLRREDEGLILNYHFAGNHPNLAVVAALMASRPQRVVQTIHHLGKFLNANWEVDVELEYETVLCCMLTDATIVTTPMKRDQLLLIGVPDDKIHVVPLGIGRPDDNPRIKRDEARRRLGLSSSDFVVLCLCRQELHKRVDTVIRAVSQMPRSSGEVHLIVVGKGYRRPDNELLAGELLPGRSQFYGYIDELDQFYEAADVLVSASEEEGFGLTHIEAAFHGVPSVARDVGGVPFAVEDGKIRGG